MAMTINKPQIQQAQSAAQPEQKALTGPIGFIGAGKVGTALASLLHAGGVQVAAIAGRTQADGRRPRFAHALAEGLDKKVVSDIAGTVAKSSIVFLTVPDDAIEPLCKQIATSGGWRAGQGVVHCSGALPSSILQSAKDAGALVASFHPLQTFASLEAAIAHLPGSTFAIEGDPELVSQLDKFVELLGGNALHLHPGEKTLYHAAAAIASNYTVTLAALASELLVQEGIVPDRDAALHYLMPLLRGTVDNLDTLGLPTALTGPLARGDVGTVSRHLKALEGCAPELAHLYRHLARLTLPLAQEKGGLDNLDVARLREEIE